MEIARVHKTSDSEAFEKYSAWCKSMGFTVAKPELYAKITKWIEPQPIAWAATKR